MHMHMRAGACAYALVVVGLASSARTGSGQSGGPPAADTWSNTCALSKELQLPYVRYLHDAPAGTDLSMSATFINLLPYDIERFWDDGSEHGIPQGRMGAYDTDSFVESAGTYEGHVFIFRTLPESAGGVREIVRYHMTLAGPTLFLVHGDDPATLASPHYTFRSEQVAWMAAYKARTGAPWLGFYGADGPRSAPAHYMWPTERLGQTHVVHTPYTHLDSAAAASAAAQSAFEVPDLPVEGGEGARQDIKLTVVSQAPKVLVVHDLLSAAECELLRGMGEAQLAESTLGSGSHSHKDNTRTSRTGWLQRGAHGAMEHIFRRFAHVLQIDQAILKHDGPGLSVAEQLQVVHYGEQQEYRSHYDFYDTGGNKTRFLTLLIYLNPKHPGVDVAEGGGTSFPKAFGGQGLQVRPPLGSAVLFYNILPDGNSDRLTEHAGLPVPSGQGEKWVSNLWVWDPQV